MVTSVGTSYLVCAVIHIKPLVDELSQLVLLTKGAPFIITLPFPDENVDDTLLKIININLDKYDKIMYNEEYPCMYSR